MLTEGLQLGRYRLRRLIGRGATGVVYLAEDQRIPRQVALKVVQSEDLGPEALKEVTRQFQHEAQTIAMLSHPHILPLFDYGEEVVDGTTLTYLVTPYCAEGSLSSWLRQHNGTFLLAPRDALAIVQQAADALDYAHDQQIIHRDVKPSNFLARSRKDTRNFPDIMLADFGIARISQATINVSKTIRGTPTYMAPEQWSGGAEPASDQYALAIMAYELLTGRPPYQGTQEQVMFHHILTPPPAPSSTNLRLTPAIDAVIVRTMAKKPTERFASIHDFAGALQRAIMEIPTNPSLSGPYIIPSGSNWMLPTPNSGQPSLSQMSPAPSLLSSSILGPAVSKDTPDIEAAFPTSVIPSSDVRTTMTISTTEAIAGTRKRVTLPDGHSISVTVPAGALDGQVLILPQQVGTVELNLPKGNVVIKLAIVPTTEAAIIEAIPDMPQSRIKWKYVLPIGLVVLLIALIASTYTLGTNLFPHNSPASNVAANSTVIAHQAANTTATASATGATATVQANSAATATVVDNPYDRDQKMLVANEVLTMNSSAQWNEQAGACFFSPAGYHVRSQGTPPQPCVARNTADTGDVTFQVQMIVTSGNAGGILFHATGSAAYYFRINTDGYYALFACTNAGITCSKTLLSGFSSSIVTDPNKPNLLAVVAKGSHIDLYINGVRINSADDTTSLHGQIGLVADAASEVVFSNAKTWKL